MPAPIRKDAIQYAKPQTTADDERSYKGALKARLEGRPLTDEQVETLLAIIGGTLQACNDTSEIDEAGERVVRITRIQDIIGGKW